MIPSTRKGQALLTIVLFVCCLFQPLTAQAQLGTTWSSPISIFETTGQVASTPMALVADPTGLVHLLFSHTPDESIPAGIDYMVLENGQWSDPVNILINPDNSPAQIVRAVMDAQSVIHVVWIGGGNKLYYSSAPVEQAGSARGWLAPTAIAESLPTEAGIAVAPDGSIWVAYADATQADAIALVRLRPGAETWASAGPPVPAGVDIFPAEVGLVIDDQGQMHLTWTVVKKPDGWPPQAVYYARSLDEGATWEIRAVAEGDYGQAGVVVPNPDDVHIFWSSTVGGDGTFHQWSSDGGQTWSPPQRFIERGGFSGLPSFGVDSLGNVHYMRGSAVYAMWDGSTLSTPRPVTTAEVCLQGQISCGERAQMTITTGNLLHAVFETDFNQLWYTALPLDAPAVLAPTANPTVTPPLNPSAIGNPPTSTPAVDTNQVAGETGRLTEFDNSPATNTGGQVRILVLSVLPSLLLVAGVVLFTITRKSRR